VWRSAWTLEEEREGVSNSSTSVENMTDRIAGKQTRRK
jgi:hypothetical protein